MSHKLLPRLGSAIASTILSLFSAVSLVGVDKAQAATLTYNFLDSRNFLKVDNSFLTGIGVEEIAVSEGRIYDFTLGGGKEYYDLAGVQALFYQGYFRGLNTSGGDQVITKVSYQDPGEPPVSFIVEDNISWRIETSPPSPYWDLDLSPGSAFFEAYEQYTSDGDGSRKTRTNRGFGQGGFSYTLVDTEAEPVPEPLTVGGTALALAGLSWLKHKKKMAA
jgi:hypothetical protein